MVSKIKELVEKAGEHIFPFRIFIEKLKGEVKWNKWKI